MNITQRDPFHRRHRRGHALGAWIAGVALTVLAYYATTPRPSRLSTDGASAVPEGETIQVGALPVT